MSSFVPLIGKVKSPHRLNDFRHISLIGCIYKIVAKVLAARLKGVLPSVVSSSEAAFLQGRQILDGMPVANEVINLVKRKKWPMHLFRVDFEKAYDPVRWSFLDYMLSRMGFNEKWRSWMNACIFSGSVSVLMNGSPTAKFISKEV